MSFFETILDIVEIPTTIISSAQKTVAKEIDNFFNL